MSLRILPTFEIRRSSEDKPLPEGTSYVLWDEVHPRQEVRRTVRQERVEAPDGRVGEATEWEEVITYRTDVPLPHRSGRGFGSGEVGRVVRSGLLIFGGFVAMSIGFGVFGGPWWIWWLLYFALLVFLL